ncbi:MAG: isoleucine--tRNA ligase [Mobiluncus sp.]|uniref:isoleucine--tRNA ligase n=1 Tax=Mobiluncus sp. TaxID=47293 RepID=UPI0025825B1D|nr:isoleucine--tRNA ligase [Mobiluncus sp.]MCI6584017.1 isoleucine--tRNA ligase [Mobiluncus sp.]
MSETKRGFYPKHRPTSVVSSPDFPKQETETLAYWKEDNTFQASVEGRSKGRDGDNEFVFYDGPPFANGLPHYGHLLTGYVKDIVGRYQTQRGKRVERRFGWDTHGLPAELEAERILGIEDKEQIEGPNGMGIEAFNQACRDSVLKYTKEWEDYVTRQARWVDFGNDYKTLDPTFMESVIWAFKTLYDKGLIYEGFKVLPYCWHDGTPLSNHELKMDDDIYQNRTDQTVTVGLRLVDTGELALIWTTTPWTLPSNLAVAVGEDIDYVTVEPVEGDFVGEKLILAAARLGAYSKELGEGAKVSQPFKGKELVGKRYWPIFDYFEAAREAGMADGSADRAGHVGPGSNAWSIIAADFVSTEDGTGLVHMAPAFGEDDMNVCLPNKIGIVMPVDGDGNLTAEVPDYAGKNVFEANRYIIADMRDITGPMAARDESKRARLVKVASYEHSYPHCWRCRKPLIYKAVSSWFVKVTDFRDRMVELNQQITWTPAHTKDGIFGNWLAGARDWSISRNRFWGAPIPVWKSDNPEFPRLDVYGSFEELERDFGVKVDNLHRPYIDELVRPNPDDPSGRSMMRRVPEVLDCWFESGSMPYAQVHYPFENRDWFETHYPGDFIVEYIGQTRGWFYTLHVLATALFDRPAFTNCISHGIVLGDDGRKMSKSLRNYPDVNEVFDKYGADAMRWFLMSSPVVSGGNLIVTDKGIHDTVRQMLLPVWNAYYFFTLYAGTSNQGAGYDAKLVDVFDRATIEKLPMMDRYLLSAARKLFHEMREDLDHFHIPEACEQVRLFMELLNNWYIRISRERFWDEDSQAFDVLYTVLEALMRAIAPLLPLVAEEIWRGLTGERSVHLTDYPDWDAAPHDSELVESMNEVRDIVSAAHALRKAEKLRVRLPLARLKVVAAHPEALAPYADLIASEVNVKQVEVIGIEGSGLKSTQELALNPKAFDPEVRKLTSALFKAQKAGEWHVDGDAVVCEPVLVDGAPVRLTGEQYSLTTKVEAEPGTAADVLPSGTFVVLDTDVTPELEAEGYARDVIRAVQDARKNAGLDVADRIDLSLGVPADGIEAVGQFQELIASETLSLSVNVNPAAELAIEVKKH